MIGCRELVARKCGNEFDKYLACGSDDGEEKDKDQESGGDNIGIAASGDVICCENRSIVEEYLQSRLVLMSVSGMRMTATHL